MTAVKSLPNALGLNNFIRGEGRAFKRSANIGGLGGGFERYNNNNNLSYKKYVYLNVLIIVINKYY